MRRSRVGHSLLAGLLMGGAVWCAPAASGAPPSGMREVLNDVHTDAIDVRFESGRLRLQTRIGQQPYRHAAADEVIFQVKDVPEAALTVPDDPAFGFLGEAGDTVWIAPQTQEPTLLFAGWDTEGLPPGTFAGDAVRLELVSVTGPGRMEVFQTGEFGGVTRIFSGADPAYRALSVPVASHAHANWAFTALGRYQATWRARATLAGGGEVVSAPATYTWFVGGTTAADVTPETSAVSLTLASTTPSVTLSATVQPGHASGWVALREGAAELGFAAVSDGTATLRTSALAPGSHQLTAHFIPRYGNDFTASVSAPVTVVMPGSPSPSPSASSSPSPSPSSSPSTSAPPSRPPSSPAVSPTPVCVPGTRYVPVLDDGHADLATRVTGDRLDTAIKDGTRPGAVTWRDPADVVLHVRPQAAVTLPAGFGFLGPAGARVWQIPQTQRAGVLWLGWNTEAVAGRVSGPVTWSLTKVSGPGRFAVYEHGSFGQSRVLFASGDGLPDRHTVTPGSHEHGNWAFTREGVYRLTFTQQATLTGGRVVRDTEVVTVVVGAVDPRPHAKRVTGCHLPRTGDATAGLAVLGGGLLAAGAVLLGAGLWRRRRAGA